jgi:glycosyltransferase involved in cell wall biosynthesis/ubiquinone/menaquinone biosynthesis C-methylase UbiE
MRCLYLAPTGELGVVDDSRLDATTERHKLLLRVEAYDRQGPPIHALDRDPRIEGLIIEMYLGWVGRDQLRLSRAALDRGRRLWVYWPGEQAIECIDRERLASHWRHWLLITGYWHGSRLSAALHRGGSRIQATCVRRARSVRRLVSRYVRRGRDVLRHVSPARLTVDEAPSPAARPDELNGLIERASPVPFPALTYEPGPRARIPGCGAYLRTDFWARIESGGSYGHTCYVAKELAAVTERFVCFMAHRYKMLDDYGLRQVVLDPPSATASEDDIVTATKHYDRILKPAFEALRPAFIYERLCLGNYVGALLSQTLQIPYIVEYNGSEISMRRSFDGTGYIYEDEYLKVEALAFKQATMISVISAEVKAMLVAQGIDPNKILVNPNGADLTAYAPADRGEKARLRAELGIAADVPVIGFTGTFGGWHGVDVLAAAIPTICERAPRAQFLLIGDGNYKHLVDRAVADHRLEGRVTAVGRVPQADGARLLKACDIYVSPHNSHMVDSRFFGSPTKIFEYMAMGGGIVASDLEQIGECLSPALTVDDLRDPSVSVTDERAVLCTPGDVDEFVDAVVALAERPHLWSALGRNAREAVREHYSWTKHVSHLWRFMAGERAQQRLAADLRRKAPRRRFTEEPVAVGAMSAASIAPSAPSGDAAPPPAPRADTLRAPKVETRDAYKDEVQRQWDNDPAGSHYVKAAEPHTLPWFLEAEAYRYAEYAPWMAETMEFARHAGERVLEIGGGMGTDLSQFARHGAVVTDIDLSSGHLELAKENFRLRGLNGEFVLHDAESLVFGDNTFDVVYSNGVLHHTPNACRVVQEIHRVLKPGGRAIIMMYAENSLHYWRNLVWAIGLKERQLNEWSMGEIMSRSVERSDHAGARPLVKVYTKKRLRRLFDGFTDIQVVRRQMVAAEVPRLLTWVPLPTLGKMMGWNLIIKARKRQA